MDQSFPGFTAGSKKQLVEDGECFEGRRKSVEIEFIDEMYTLVA
jgi:hypothetical protein